MSNDEQTGDSGHVVRIMYLLRDASAERMRTRWRGYQPRMLTAIFGPDGTE
ncbi:MAG: hypothetical protein LBK66_09675 [Spirochaetaceae bacterium]|jgi:hypothetical protein|nr:hypothetical protein [Spirochaetaceae bacterium]